MVMAVKAVQFFTKDEEALADILIGIGIKRNVAKVLVFLANSSEATSRDIERGTDLRQPEVSLAMRYLAKQGWLSSRDKRSENKGRPQKIFNLSKPVPEIMRRIEKEKKREAANRLALVQRLHEFV